jgi:hypothetical protein
LDLRFGFFLAKTCWNVPAVKTHMRPFRKNEFSARGSGSGVRSGEFW